MRITNKYIRNKRYRIKHWNTIRNRSHPYETFCPYSIHQASSSYWERRWDTENQIKSNFEWITEQARALESGHHRSFFHAPKHFRKTLWKRRKAQEKAALRNIRNGEYDTVVPLFKKDADWDWF